MAIKKDKKIIGIIVLVVCISIGLITVVCLKLKNNYILKIVNAFDKTLNSSSTDFILEYSDNRDEFEIIGSLEYSYKKLDVLMSGLINNKKIVADINLEKSTVAYFIETFNYWLTMDITESATEILNKVKCLGEKSILESFPVKDILKLTSIDEKIDISKYPNKLSKKFIFKFINNNFKKDVLRFEENKKTDKIVYSVTPNIYEVLMKFIESSDINKEDKKICKEELEKNKENLENLKLVLTIEIDKNGYIKEFFYSEIENDNVKKINLKLENINNTEVRLEEEVLNKLTEE